ncbi:TonB-dependent receptor [Pseudemcibacter aquimaris]|uniref:TonB-dependent receptor n=1 Tax=Pseudemcibacter aquimaris TaxID=2857064 RepID=UPI0020134FF0|nr:TonB-dependent receptor [Pseudemcibacter aquimaris]MCC3862112.1 TonB-dependent receptor [Pseudemcibacter aquimaris]WDU58865.1 TonB-dependent receptor [Pseudemcibacter aquimaris]
MKIRMGNKRARLLAGVSAISLGLGMAGTATAQEAQDSDQGDVETIVTVGKRPENVLDVPVAMTAYNAEFMDRVNLDDVKDLIKFSPGFAGDSKDSFIDFVNIRGISTIDYGVGGDPSVGFFKNNMYQGRQGSAVTSMYDMERAEVLRGPQGFLFGRNAISGAISFHTKRPDMESVNGYVDLGVGERGLWEADGAINLPVNENFAIRVAGYTSHEDGWMTNTLNATTAAGKKYGGHKKSAGRFSAAIEGEGWDAFFVAEYEDRDQDGTVYRAQSDEFTDNLEDIFGTGWMPDTDDLRSFKSHLGLGNDDSGEIVTINAEINIDLEFATLTSLTGFKDHKYNYAENYGGTGLDMLDYGQEQDGDYFEEEIRLVSNTDGPLSWYAGASFYKENIDALFKSRSSEDIMCAYYNYYGYDNCADLYAYYSYAFTPSDGLNEPSAIIGEYTGWAAYVNMAYEVTDKFDVEVGVRYTKDTKDFSFNALPVTSDLGPYWNIGFTTDGYVREKITWDDYTPRFIARYRPDDNTMIYGSITKGYKSGGFNSFGADLTDGNGGSGVDDDYVALPGTTPNEFGPETVWSYELGVKGSNPENTIKYDFAGYYYKYEGLQFTYFDRSTQTANVGEVTSYGVEGTVQAFLGENVNVILSGSYNHNEIKDANLIAPGSDGNRLSGAPKYKGAFLLNYTAPVTQTGEVNASFELAAQSSLFVGLGNIPSGEMEGWADATVRLGYADDAGWSITAYVENVFDKVYYDGGYEGGDIQPTVFFGPSRPRTFGARLSYRFGGS